jgi:hypothetical protein
MVKFVNNHLKKNSSYVKFPRTYFVKEKIL